TRPGGPSSSRLASSAPFLRKIAALQYAPEMRRPWTISGPAMNTASPVASSPPDRAVSVAIVGAGPAGLMAAECLAQGGVVADVFDAMPSVGRKFLLAGRGGLNLTHSEPAEPFLARYGERSEALREALAGFDGVAVRAWAE